MTKKMKSKIIAIAIISIFLLAGVSVVSARETIKTQETKTYPFVRLEMKEGKLEILEGLGWPAPFMFLSEILSKIMGKDHSGIVLWTKVRLKVTEGELTVRPTIQQPITLYPGDEITMKMLYGYLDGFSNSEVKIIKGTGIGFAVLN